MSPEVVVDLCGSRSRPSVLQGPDDPQAQEVVIAGDRDQIQELSRSSEKPVSRVAVRRAAHRLLNSDPHRKLAPEVVPKSSSCPHVVGEVSAVAHVPEAGFGEIGARTTFSSMTLPRRGLLARVDESAPDLRPRRQSEGKDIPCPLNHELLDFAGADYVRSLSTRRSL